METKNKIIAAIGAVALAGAAFAGGYAVHQPDNIVEQVEVIKEVPLITEKIVKVEKIVEVAGAPVEVFVEDEAFLKKVCDRMMYEDLVECKDEVIAEDNALVLAFEELDKESKVFDLLEDEGLIEDEDEAKIIKVYKDFDEVEILESDYDDKEYEFLIKAKVKDEDADVKKYFLFRVSVEDGEAEIEDVSEL